MRVIVLMLAGGPGVTRWGRLFLPWCAQGGPMFPSMRGVLLWRPFSKWCKTFVRPSELLGRYLACQLDSASFHPAMTLGDQPVPHTWGFLHSEIQQYKETSRAHVLLVATHQQNSKLCFIQTKLFIHYQEFKYCMALLHSRKGKIKRQIELKKSKWNNPN